MTPAVSPMVSRPVLFCFQVIEPLSTALFPINHPLCEGSVLREMSDARTVFGVWVRFRSEAETSPVLLPLTSSLSRLKRRESLSDGKMTVEIIVGVTRPPERLLTAQRTP